MVESVFWPRLRWRMRGAWQWPTFGALTVADAVLAARLPFHGDGADAAGAVLLACFFNLLVVAVAAPLAGMLLRRRRPDLPRMIARDYAGTALLGLVTVAFVTGGLLHRSGRLEEQRDRVAAMAATHAYVLAQAPQFRAGLVAPDLQREEADLYRVCVYRGATALCLFVNTGQSPAGVTRDPSRVPNRQSPVTTGRRSGKKRHGPPR
jgi:hypothetical protein